MSLSAPKPHSTNITLHTFGDSHASHHGGWADVSLNNINIKINHLGPMLLHSFGRDSIKFVDQKHISRNDIICFCFGEIDCRCHVNKFEPDWMGCINILVDKYFENIVNNVSDLDNVKVCVYNVVPPLERELPEYEYIKKWELSNRGVKYIYPALGDDKQRLEYTKYMNRRLKELCDKNYYIYFDIYEKYCNEKGFLNVKYSDGNCHIKDPIFIQEFIIDNLGGETRSMGNLILEPIHPFQARPIAEIGSLAPAVEAERAGLYVVAWQEALKAISLRPFHPEAYIQMASTAVAAGDPEAALAAAQRALALTPKWPTAQQVVKTLERTLNAHRKQRKKVSNIAWPELPYLTRKPRLSVCMIVKNEERFLGQCLASVKNIADELIVIDTGSTDRTIEIAREHGAQVGHFEWCNDFAAARNASIAPATGDWILFLDADEQLSPIEKAELPGLLSQTQVSLYRLPLINTHEGEKSRSYVPRLFRNPPGLMFFGCVHEGVLSFIEKNCNPWGLSIDFCNLKILHHGYEPAVMQERNKIQRNHDLLRKAIQEHPNEFYFHMQLGLELGRMGKKEESFQEYAEALRLAETIAINKITPEVRETLLTQYSAYLIVEKRFTEVIEVLTGALAKNGPLTASHLMVRARAYIHLKQPIKALNDAELAHSYRMNGTLFPSAINPQSLALEAMMAEVFFINQRYPEALEYFSVALKMDRPELRTVLSYTECLDRIGKTGEALEYLHDIILNRSNIPAIWIHGASLLLRHEGLKAVAAEWIAEAKVYHPENIQVDALVNRVKQKPENDN